MNLNLSEKAISISPSSTLAIDAKFKSMKAKGIDVVGFGAGEPDFDTPQHIKEAAIKAINEGFTKYTPAAGMPGLKEAVCRKLKKDNNLAYSPEQIVISNGAKHSLVNVFTAICNPGDEVIIPAPFWVSYPEMVKLADGVPVLLPTNEKNQFKFTIDDLKKVVTSKTKALVLNSPSNPTGMIYTEDELKEIAEFAVQNNIYVVSDEIYEHLIYDGLKHVSIASFGEAIKDLTIIVNGVSKTYAMTGWRIGYTASNAKIAKVMGNVQSHATSNPNSIAQVAAIAALDGPQDEIEEMKKAFVERRNYMVDRINSIEGLSCSKPQGAFYVMMNINSTFGKEYYGKTINNSDEFADLLLEKANVALVPGSGFGAEGYVRWSYATSMQNIVEGLNRIEKFLNNEL
ncbi:pyridoxal phosphate-dependent aminotransferase [Petroclostridium sp. X23]|uniref:pyridoxal phosphate-dependent aminotransferase n=1 Tax=Petroclostridium sp. X23 TaxID=3045146 RepID=UPI0024AD3CCF|nr:pyridoxal phosphate-dependent aminotransferase [Petroclostridium sp. X23]WHH59434.1 pyridoxal phosphate-dependent aminotransferase [Petroclostridium sp. X23]